MSNQQKARLFQPFTKIKSNRQLNKEGVGLGLAVSKNIAVALSGNIDVTSEQGKGSTFILKLPLT
jgi:signal transduction histidine kinase